MALNARAWIEAALYRVGLFISRPTSQNEVAAALELLKPRSCATPLVRIGSTEDGGYLLPDDLRGISALFSPGVAENWSFEVDIVRQSPMPAYLCDRFPISPECPFEVDDFWLGPSTQGDTVSLADWVSRRAPDAGGDLLLQMDIEGAEYLTILACPVEVLRRFRIIAIELHALHRLLDRSWFEAVYLPFLQKLSSEFTVVHVHPNNAASVDRRSGIDIPRTLEVTLFRNDRFVAGSEPVQLPHPLDAMNVRADKDVALSDVWRQ